MTDAPNLNPMADEQRAALAKSNLAETEMAHRLAAEHRAREQEAGGIEKPLVQSLADSVKGKLLSEDFHKK